MLLTWEYRKKRDWGGSWGTGVISHGSGVSASRKIQGKLLLPFRLGPGLGDLRKSRDTYGKSIRGQSVF